MASLRLSVLVTSTILLLSATSCKDEGPAEELPPASGSSAADGLPDGVTRVGGDAPAKPSGPAFKAQEGWTEVPPTSGTRAGQFQIADGPIDLVIFAWPNDVGGLESNIARWIGAGRERESLTDDELATFEVDGGFTVTTLFIEREGPAADDGAHGPTGDAIFRAYIEKDGTERTWSLKADGPREAMLRQRPAFDAFVRSL